MISRYRSAPARRGCRSGLVKAEIQGSTPSTNHWCWKVADAALLAQPRRWSHQLPLKNIRSCLKIGCCQSSPLSRHWHSLTAKTHTPRAPCWARSSGSGGRLAPAPLADPSYPSARRDRLDRRLAKALRKAEVRVTYQPADALATSPRTTISAGLICSGSRAPGWLAASGLPCCPHSGRVFTNNKLQVIDQPQIFASGDCAVIDTCPRPPSGVWAVRAAIPLALNLQASCQKKTLRKWRPQRKALQLIGGFKGGLPIAWALWGPLLLGPHPWWWRLKARIDRSFMHQFQTSGMNTAKAGVDGDQILCRGCAAKIPATTLEAALSAAGVGDLATAPEDAAVVPTEAQGQGRPLLQSVDGFPH